METEARFSELGRVEALSRLYEDTPFRPFEPVRFEGDGIFRHCDRTMAEGLDFDLTYFPLKHLGHKCVTAVTGELTALLARPLTLCITLGVSARFDFPQIRTLWQGMVAAAREYGYSQAALDLAPSLHGLQISVSATGEESRHTAESRPAVRNRDLICLSGNLGGAFFGMRLLEREKRKFERTGTDCSASVLEKYRMMVESYLLPELDTRLVGRMEETGLLPSSGYLCTKGLADTVKRMAWDSGQGAKIYAEKLPFEGNSFALGKEMDIDPISAAMNGGEDYRLVFTVPVLEAERFRREFQTFEIIGHLALPEAGTVLVTPDGAEMELESQGWR